MLKKTISVCLIPARGGSKRIKNKNIKYFYGKPLIAYAIEKALNSKLFDKVYVSTDSKKIALIAKRYGAEIPFYRPKIFSNDESSDNQVINHFLDFVKQKNFVIGNLCYLYPVTPLLTITTLKKSYQIIKKGKFQKVIMIGKFSYPIQRALTKGPKQEIKFVSKKFSKFRSQELKDYYHDAGQCYWFNIKKLKNKKISNNLKTAGLELKSHEFHDVDTLEDLEVLKRLFKIKR